MSFLLSQVCGGYTDQMAQVAQLLDEQLGDGIDFLDINCGRCSWHPLCVLTLSGIPDKASLPGC